MSISRPERASRLASWVLAGALLVSAGAAHAGLSEQWYLLRASANMEIRNYTAAIEAYRKVLAGNPTHREAMRGLGVAYAENGQTDEAIAAFDRYLERHTDDPEVAFRQAKFLGWSRYAYRRKDAIKYYRMGLDDKDAPRERHALAKLLAQDKATLDDALAEYRKLVKQLPEDPAIRAEYRKLLVWEPRHREEAIREYERLHAERPEDAAVTRQLARMLAEEPSRIDDSAALYAKLVAGAPGDRGLRLEYARVLAKDPARSEEAREQLRAGMKGKPDYETRVLYADLLAADEDEREEALVEYRRLVEEQPKNNQVRLKYARMLGAHKETNREAAAQYEQVVARQPKNGAAHAGLARAYSWEGDSDRALHHNQLALKYGAERSDMRALEDDLGEGREPRAGGGVTLLVQPGDFFGLFGFQLPLRGRADVNAFATLSAEAGFEYYAGEEPNSAAGAFFSAGGELRFNPDQRARLAVGYRTVRPGAEGLSALVEYQHRLESISVSPRFERLARFDSFQALVGGRAGAGAVSGNLFSVKVQYERPDWRAWAVPLAGFISGQGVDANGQFGLEAGIEKAFIEGSAWKLLAGYESVNSHYGNDTSPAAGGYFRPALYWVQTPRLTVRRAVAREHFLELSGGPSLQYQQLHGEEGAWLPGGQVRLVNSWRFAERFEWDVGGAFSRIGNAYSRFDASTSLNYVF